MKLEDILTEINKKQEELERLVNKAGVEKLDGFVGNTWMTIEIRKPVKPQKQHSVRLEQGKFYRTKSGRKVYIATDDKHWCYGIIEGDTVATTFERNGFVHYSGRDKLIFTTNDIVSEWK